MRFQDRDAAILTAIYHNDGVLAKRHLKTLFWCDTSWRAMEKRLAKLHQGAYLDWPDSQQWRHHPIPEPICWLGWKGALYVAALLGINVTPPKEINENQQRRLQTRLRRQGIRWVRHPRWSLLRHDLAITDFRWAIEGAVSKSSRYMLENWISESVFRARPDEVTYETKSTNGKPRQVKKGVCPDAYFAIIDEIRRARGEPAKARFLLELDMATHDTLSFGREKVVPGLNYIQSSAYKARFGNNRGAWLVVTKGEQIRLKNLIAQTEEKAGAQSRLFFFTTLGLLEAADPLIDPVWRQGGRNALVPLLSG